MLGIELTTSQKVGIASCVLILGVSAYLLISGFKAPPDLSIAVKVVNYRYGADPKQKISATNPEDPKKAKTVTTFMCYDGRLDITEYSDSESRAMIDFQADSRRKNFELYQDLWAKLNEISDPYKKVIAFAAYANAENQNMFLFRRAQIKLTTEQMAAEAKARDAMVAAVTGIDTACRLGTFKPDAYNKVMDALTAYRAGTGDPSQDPVRAAAARKVLKLGVQYLEMMDKEKKVAIDNYVAAMDSILTADQKKALADHVQLAQRPKPKPVTAG